MSTLRDIISDVRGMHKLISTDAMITDRVIASEVINNSLLLIKRETNLRKLWATDTIFTTIQCMELIEVPITECCDYDSNITVARSKTKLPKIAEGNYQYIVQGVYSVNALGGAGKKFKEITINRYINLLQLPIIMNDIYWWISDDYLYVSNSDAEKVRFVALFEQPLPNYILYSDCNCGGKQPTLEEYCKNPLDRDFYLPGYLKKQVLDLTSKTLRESYFSLRTDISSEGIDGQAPNSSGTN